MFSNQLGSQYLHEALVTDRARQLLRRAQEGRRVMIRERKKSRRQRRIPVFQRLCCWISNKRGKDSWKLIHSFYSQLRNCGLSCEEAIELTKKLMTDPRPRKRNRWSY